jgi:hypothetical protein
MMRIRAIRARYCKITAGPAPSGPGTSTLPSRPSPKPSSPPAWKRAARWQQHGMKGISQAEAPLLRALWAVQVQMEKRGVPVGQVPS